MCGTAVMRSFPLFRWGITKQVKTVRWNVVMRLGVSLLIEFVKFVGLRLEQRRQLKCYFEREQKFDQLIC